MFKREERRSAGFAGRMPARLKNFFSALNDLRTFAGRARVAKQSRETGFKITDDTVRAISAGMGLADVRALFRGDPPVEEPNPRDQVFTNAFLAHTRPRYYEKSSTKFTHTFGLGFFSVFFSLVAGITGVILMIFYIPSQDQAYQSTVKIVAEVPFGQLVRDIHRVGAELLLLVVFLHMVRVYLTGSFKHPRQFTWVTGVILLIITLGFSLSGYLLSLDQSSYWGAMIGTGAIKSAPPKEIIGNTLNLLLRGGDAIGQNGLSRFYLLHVILLPVLAIIFVAVHYYRVSRLHSISLPASEEESPDPQVREAAKEHIDYLPDILTKELMWVAIGVFAIVAFAAFAFDAPLGRHADPSRAPLHTTAPWYLLWMQGMLRDLFVLPLLRGLRDFVSIDLVQFYDSPAWQGVILPMVILLFLFGVPYIDECWDRFRGRPSSRLGKNRKLGIVVGLASLFLLALFTYFGTPSFAGSASPAVKIGQEFMPEECVLPPIPLIPEDCGEVRRLGFNGLPVGTYELAQFATLPANATRFESTLTKVQAQVQEQAERGKQSDDVGLADAKGFFVVEDWQNNLKKVTLRITWMPRAQGDTGSFEKIIYLHHDSAY